MSKEEEIEDGEDFSLTAKMKMVMGVCQTVQNSLDLVASYCERVKKYVRQCFCRYTDHKDLRILDFFPFIPNYCNHHPLSDLNDSSS